MSTAQISHESIIYGIYGNLQILFRIYLGNLNIFKFCKKIKWTNLLKNNKKPINTWQICSKSTKNWNLNDNNDFTLLILLLRLKNISNYSKTFTNANNVHLLDDNKLNLLINLIYSFSDTTPLRFTCSKITIETLEKGVKYVQS